MKLAIVMPVVLQTEALLALTQEAVSHLRSRHTTVLYVVCNRLHVRVPQILQSDLQARFRGQVVVVHEPGVERSVAGAWNKGCELALADGADYVVIVANDTRLREDCLDKLIEFGERGVADLWSAISFNNRNQIDPNETADGADFSCFMIRPGTLQRHGFFDPNYRPAYFEDNDYYGRVVLGGGECRVVHGAQFFHHGSMTVREDAEMAHQLVTGSGKTVPTFPKNGESRSLKTPAKEFFVIIIGIHLTTRTSLCPGSQRTATRREDAHGVSAGSTQQP
jgi:GT2 family glycosyltransferase